MMAAASAILQAVPWLLATGLRSVRGGPTRRAPPLRGEHAVRRVLPVSQPHDPGQDQFRRGLTEALARGRPAAYARVVPTDGCQGRLRMAEGSDQLSRWMRPSCYEVEEDVSRLLQAWVVRAHPESQDLASFSRRIASEPAWQKHCTKPELLLLSDVVATVSQMVRSGRPLYDSLEELAQVLHLLARGHMPDHFQTRRGSTTWLQWMAVVVPALWLTLLWAMQLRGGVRRRRRAKMGVRSLYPLIQLALGQGSDAGPRARGALDEFLARQCLLVVAPPPEEACMYVFASRLDIYVGIMATSRVTARTATSGAACRYWEHLVDIRKPAARGPSAEPSRKVACFRQCRAGHVAMLVVALGPRREVASLEATAIASSGCRGNTAGARGAGLMPRRHRTQAGRTRARQPGSRRAGLPDALRAPVHCLSLADGRRRRSEDREPRREAGRLTDRLRELLFAERYAAWQRARWHLGLGECPVDVLGPRGDTLLAAWLAGTGQVCYESLLQRAAGDDLVAFRACDAAQGMRHADGKRRALDRVSRLLRLWRLPA